MAVPLLGASSSWAGPTLVLPGTQTVAEGEALTFAVSARDPEGQLVELYASNLPTGASFTDNHNSTGTFRWTPGMDQAGSYVVYFLADDTFGGTDTGSVQIDVLNANTPPELSSIGDRSVEQGTTSFVSLNGYDPDGDPLSYSATGLPSYATLTDNGDGTGTLTLAPTMSTPAGSTTMTVTLSDGQTSVSETFTVTVTGSATQNPPVLAAIGSQTVNEGAVTSVALSASDPDGSSLSWSVSLPTFATLTPTGSGPGTLTATLDLAPGYCHAGSYPASIAVSDGAMQDAESFTITVQEVNRAPVWAELAYAASFDEGAETSLVVQASDPDQVCGIGAPLLTLASSDAGDLLVTQLEDAGNGTATLHLAAGANGAGTYHVTLRATDRVDASLTRDVVVTVTVTDVPVPVVSRAWAESEPIRLRTGKPRERVYLEAVSGYDVNDVLATSLRLTAWAGAGSVSSITPVPGTIEGGHDRDANGVSELRMDFAKDDLRLLMAYVSDRVDGEMTLTATLADGRHLTATVPVSVAPERKIVISRVGPNPLNPESSVTIMLEQGGPLYVQVFDVKGRLTRTLLRDPSAVAGEHVVRFDGKDDRGVALASGRYFVRAQTTGMKDVTPITILK